MHDVKSCIFLFYSFIVCYSQKSIFGNEFYASALD